MNTNKFCHRQHIATALLKPTKHFNADINNSHNGLLHDRIPNNKALVCVPCDTVTPIPVTYKLYTHGK